jgi:hypothetical protein
MFLEFNKSAPRSHISVRNENASRSSGSIEGFDDNSAPATTCTQAWLASAQDVSPEEEVEHAHKEVHELESRYGRGHVEAPELEPEPEPVRELHHDHGDGLEHT